MNSEAGPTIEDFVRRMAQFMQIPCELTVTTDDGGTVRVAIQSSENGRLLIGKNGQNLNALEHVVKLMWMRRNPDHRNVIVDVNNYRTEQNERLVSSVREAAIRVQQTHKSEALPPMTSYERRVVHTELAMFSDLSTESVGQDPHRRVVIKPL